LAILEIYQPWRLDFSGCLQEQLGVATVLGISEDSKAAKKSWMDECMDR